MKKIMMLSIGLMCASVQAVDFSEVEITETTVSLSQNSEFVASVRALCEQGLMPAQIAELLMHTDEMRVYVGKDGDGQRNMRPWTERSCTEKVALVAVVLAIIAINFYCAKYHPEYFYEDYY